MDNEFDTDLVDSIIDTVNSSHILGHTNREYLFDTINDILSNYNSFQLDLESKDEEIISLERKLETLESNYENLKELLDERDDTIDTLLSDIAELKDRVEENTW
jgi:peptidoglycan hydrolase CwlO-like protein